MTARGPDSGAPSSAYAFTGLFVDNSKKRAWAASAGTPTVVARA